MANMLDYIDWRGDITIHQSGINDVDCLIMAQISYMNFDGVVGNEPAASFGEAVVTLSEASQRLFELRDSATKGLLLSDNDTLLLKKLASSRRFGSMKLAAYRAVADEEEEKQFGAVCIFPGDATVYISYRGTDDTIVGWKEDLNMSFQTPVPSQVEALKYLNTVAGTFEGRIRIGGHSKGGNLAIYASVMCYDRLKRRIIEIYNNDGPGFLEPMLEKESYIEIKDRIRTIVPETSIVGMLLEHGDSYEVVKSVSKGIMQHDGLSWQVYKNGFVKLDERSKESLVIDSTLRTWIMGLNDEERIAFVDAIYDMLTKAGIRYLSDLEQYKPAMLNNMAKEMFSMEPDKAKMMRRITGALVSEYGRSIVKNIRGDKREKDNGV